MEFSFQPVTKRNWMDLERLFEARGGPHYCWCTLWRKVEGNKPLQNSKKKKACLKQLVDQGEIIGILAYQDSRPVGWCSVGPRSTFRKLGGEESLRKVWSIVCFFIERPFRDRGLMSLMIEKAAELSRRHGAHYLEAFPVDKDSPSYRFMGFVSTFSAAGFHIGDHVGKRRIHALLSLR